MSDKINYSDLNEHERIDTIKSYDIEVEVLEYLKEKFENLKIEVCGYYEGTLLDLMKRGRLEGWCWQTTATAIVFLNDDDYIERGDLTFSKWKSYYHSWICFKYNDIIYVLDPCLNILCKKELYYEVFELSESSIKGVVTANEVRDKLIYFLTHTKQTVETESEMRIRKMMEGMFGSALDRQKDEKHVSGNDDVTSPMYRNSTGYKAELSDDKIKKLVAHFYMNG